MFLNFKYVRREKQFTQLCRDNMNNILSVMKRKSKKRMKTTKDMPDSSTDLEDRDRRKTD